MLPPIVYYENFLFDIPDRIYLNWTTGKMPREQVQYRDVVQDVLTSLQMDLSVDKHLVERYSGGEATRSGLENIQAVLDRASGQLTEVVITAWRQIVKNTDQKLEVSLGNGLEQDEKGIFIQLKVKEGIHTFYIRERSLGFRWFFGFILFTHFRTYRDNSRRNALFLLDEPASNLHPAAQTKLLSAFAALPNNQLVIYSTHSHHMINPEWLSGAYVVRNAGHSYEGLDLKYNASMTDIQAERYYQFAAQHPHETDLYRPIMEVLEYRPGPMELIPELVIVEGKNDYYTIRYMSEVAGLAGTLNVYPATGKDKVDSIVALYLAWGRKFLVLLDDDRGGRETRTRLIRLFGDIAADHILTLGDINKTFTGANMEDLFEAADRDRITKATFPGSLYDKGKFNTSLQRLLIEKEPISLHAKTENRFRTLLNHLRQRLS
jgi:5S rRNA maturation endonuclease (ribonuclease M5)